MFCLQCIHLESSHFDALIPVDDVSGESERLDIDDVHIAAFSPDVHPLGLERQVTERNSTTTQSITVIIISRSITTHGEPS